MGNIQYTVRNISPELDARLRAKARREKKSLNKLLIDQLSESLKQTKSRRKRNNDYDKFVGTWVDDPGFDEAMKDMRVVDPKDWR